MSRNIPPTIGGRRWLRGGTLVALILVGGLAAVPLVPQAVERPRQVVAAGHNAASEGVVTLRTTFGQPFVGARGSGSVRLGQGFWHGGEVSYAIFLPPVLRGGP